MIAPIALLLVAVWIIALNPIGLVGGGYDDGKYLEAVRCWVAAGKPCLPDTHWASRWPVVAPIALATGLFGESRVTIAIAPLLYTCASLALMVFVGNRLFGRPSGYVAAAVLVLTPVYATQTLDPAADGAELAWLLASFAAAIVAFDRDSRGSAVASGILLGIAAQARDTSLMMFPIAAVAAMLLSRQRRALLWTIPAMFLPMAIEALTYWIVAGDPWWRFRLSLGHVNQYSAELPEGFDTSQSPLFNPHYIAAWKREAGIEIFWAIDPWLNILGGFRLGITLIAAILLAILYAGRFLDSSARRTLAILVGAALLYSSVLIYGLAIDPKSRMFFILAAACSLAIGAIAWRAWQGGGKLGVATVFVAFLPLASLSVALQSHTRSSERAARVWIARFPGQIEVDKNTRSYFMLVDGFDRIPDRGNGKPLLILKAANLCSDYVRPRPGQPTKAIVVASQQMGGWKNPKLPAVSEMCLVRYTTAYREGAESRR